MRFVHVPAVIAVLLALTGSVRATGRVTRVVLRNPADQPVKNVPIAFGQVFKKGDIKRGVVVKAIGAIGQADVKRRHDDGSVRFAAISLFVPSLPARGELAVELFDGAVPAPVSVVSPAGLLETEFDATVRLRFPDGTEKSISVRKLIRDAGAGMKTWLRGPVCVEYLLDGPPADNNGTADPDLNVQFQVRVYKGIRGVRVSAVVENCWDTWAGNIGYDVTVDTAGKTVYEKSGVNHGRLSRWRKVFWWPADPATLDVIHDLEYMSACGALPHYDPTLTVSAPKQPPSGANFDSMGFDRWRTMDDVRVANPANPRWLAMVWWEHDYLIWSLHHLTELGFSDAAKPRDFLLRWRVGSFIHPDEFDPRMSAPYRTIIGEAVPGGKPILYQDWKKLAEENIKFGNKPELPTYGGSYSYSARMAVACAVDANFPGADEALKVIEKLLPDWHRQLTLDPTFAISPRKAGK